MRADEFLVERYLELEKKCKALEEKIQMMEDASEEAMEEVADYDNLVHILSKYLAVNKYTVTFELKKYVDEDKSDILYLKNYFDLTEPEEE